jgi:ABC-type transport system involved in multi-copper enzyme maturation permease subunit
MNLIRSEFRKVRFARTYRYLILSSTALAALSCIASPYALHSQALTSQGMTMPGLNDPQMVSGMYAKSVGGYIFVVIIGVLMMAGEFRNRTAVATFLAAPRRQSVFFAKLLVAICTGVTTMLLAVGIGSLSCWATLKQFNEAVAPADGTFVHLASLAIVSGAVLAVVGLALGTLIRNQGFATGVAVVWLYIIDTILVLLWPSGGKFLPSGLITGMMSLNLTASAASAGVNLDTSVYLSPTPAALLLLSYGAVFAAVAMVTTMRRDID